MKPKKGNLLVAAPSILNDSSFNKTVILLTEHNSNNSVGFIFNKPLAYSLKDLIPEIDCSFVIYNGGPVEQDNLYFIHTIPHLIPESIEVSNGVYWGGNFIALKELLNNETILETDIRFFLGYSGWEKNQLNAEITENTWFVTENDFQNIFNQEAKQLWKNKLLQKGGNYKLWANAPDDYNLN